MSDVQKAISWAILLLTIGALGAAWWRVGLRWNFEQRRILALLSLSLLTTRILYGFYGYYVEKWMPRGTPEQFYGTIKMATHHDAIGWLFSVAALISAIAWRRTSKYLASGLALGLGIWMTLQATMNLVTV